MAKNREMLKEAIAEAKAVKEMAIANAKVALEEAFTPQLKNMLSLKLQEMEDEDSKKSMEEMKYEEDDDKSMKEEKMYDEDDSKESMEEMKYEEDDSKESMEEEVNLDELLAELEEDASLEEGKEEDETVDENISEDEDMEVEDEESETEEVEGEPLDLEDMTDEDLKSMIEDVISDMVKSGELEAGEEEMGDDADVMDMDMDMDSEEEELEEEINLSELLKEIEDLKEEEIVSERKKGKKEEEKSEKEDKKKKSEKEDKDLKEDLNKKLEEAYSAIKILKSELNEVNILNAKLLYSNKIFKAKNLNESQKLKVLSSFDKAKNVGEVKLVFETLNEGLKKKTTSNSIKENLGSASKGTSTPKVKKPIVESSDVYLRMQKLAGII